MSDDNHLEYRYEETSDPTYPDWAAANFTVQSESGGLRLDGTCPRCKHLMTNWWFDEIYRGRHSAVTSDFEVPMVCTCAAKHLDTPGSREGCGAYWVTEVQ